MIGIFGKKKQDKEKKSGKTEKKKKQPEATGPRWVALVIMALSVVAGLFFWMYGSLGSELSFGGGEVQSKVKRELENDEGLIIFERRR